MHYVQEQHVYCIFTLDKNKMMVAYNPKDDAWSNPCINKEESYYLPFGG